MSIRRKEMEVLHIEEKKAIVMTVIYEGEPECAEMKAMIYEAGLSCLIKETK